MGERESESEYSKMIILWGIQCEGYRHSGSFSINLKISKYKNYGVKEFRKIESISVYIQRNHSNPSFTQQSNK